jgi:hypothetical protein
MSGPKELEILISEDGETMHVIAHNFQGKGCEAVVNAFRFGNVVESSPTSEYFQREDQHNILKQGQ